MDFASMDNAALTAALTEAREKAAALFALEAPTIEQVDEAETVVASIAAIEGEQATRAAAVKDAEQRFAAAKATFSTATVEETEVEVETPNEGDEPEAETTNESSDSEETADEEADAESEADTAEEATVTASVNHTNTQRISAAKAVAAKVKRPAVKSAPPVTITASADVPGFGNGQSMDSMEQVTKALMGRVNGFGKFNLRSAQAQASQSGGAPVLHKFGVASFGMQFDPSLVANGANDYAVVRKALTDSTNTLVASMAPGADPTLTSAGWCAPSENVYTWMADYVVDGLVTVAEVSAPRGGINITTGPRVGGESQGTANLDGFGFVQTEAQAEAGQEKSCETIVCPDFVDHRLDAIGYCYKIPILTQKAYPELITDALKFASVMYAHKVNARVINDMVALSDTVAYSGYGPSFSDTLEALSIIAIKERRKFNLGRNAVLQVKLPEWVREVLRMDISRRNAVTVDAISDAQIDANFSVRNLAVEYVADWQELTGVDAHLPGEFKAMMFPAGTFIKAVEDVINLSAVYDAASLTINEYTGVFFEQGILVAKAGYASKIVTIPVNTAGEMGALTLTGFGDAHANGSF